MKTKEELLKKYEGTEFYGCINAYYGRKESFQMIEGGLLNFDIEAMKDIDGAGKLTYPDFIDIQIQTGKNYRGSFMRCYYYNPIEFKGEVETFGKGTICFKRIYVDGMFPDGDMLEGKEDHVWMSSEGFGKLNKGDCISFFAEAYRYIKEAARGTDGANRTCRQGVRIVCRLPGLHHTQAHLPTEDNHRHRHLFAQRKPLQAYALHRRRGIHDLQRRPLLLHLRHGPTARRPHPIRLLGRGLPPDAHG